MGIKKYIFSALVLVIIVAGYAFFLESGDYKVEIFNTVFLLPVAFWIIIPTIVLFIASLFHMLYYSFKQYLTNRSINKDKDKLIELIKDKLIGNPTIYKFKNNLFQEVGNILNQLNLSISKDDFNAENKILKNLADKVIKVQNGEYVSLKEFKLEDNSNLIELNNLNRIKTDDSYCMEILNKSSQYNEQLIEKAFIKIIEDKSFTTIKKLLETLTLNKNMTIALLNTDASYKDQFTFTINEIIKLIEEVNFTKEDYFNIAKQYTNRMSPDQIIKLFEDISSKDEEANEAYLYVLFEYEMIDDIREIINNSQKDEFIPYKALLDLKDNGKNYRFDNICYLNA
jgi:hypothetical protein